ncbi:hypothetical protein LJB71_09920 [Thermomonas sp. S9]|nr:hypothetical protein [Thermomonas sp. S9]
MGGSYFRNAFEVRRQNRIAAAAREKGAAQRIDDPGVDLLRAACIHQRAAEAGQRAGHHLWRIRETHVAAAADGDRPVAVQSAAGKEVEWRLAQIGSGQWTLRLGRPAQGQQRRAHEAFGVGRGALDHAFEIRAGGNPRLARADFHRDRAAQRVADRGNPRHVQRQADGAHAP